jgi:hypothetical protein
VVDADAEHQSVERLHHGHDTTNWRQAASMAVQAQDRSNEMMSLQVRLAISLGLNVLFLVCSLVCLWHARQCLNLARDAITALHGETDDDT